MDTVPAPTDAARSAVEAEHRGRLAREAADIAEADADIAADRLVDAAAVRAWLDSIGTDHELPVPRAGR